MPYLSTKQVQEILQISRPTVMKLIRLREITAIKGPGRTSPMKIDEDSVRKYIERSRVRASA